MNEFGSRTSTALKGSIAKLKMIVNIELRVEPPTVVPTNFSLSLSCAKSLAAPYFDLARLCALASLREISS